MDIALFISLIGAGTGLAAIILQFRKQRDDRASEEVKLRLAQDAQALEEQEHGDNNLFKVSTLSVSLLAPLQQQIDVLTRRVDAVETQSAKYRRWIAELVIVIRKLVLLLQEVGQDVDIHQAIVKDVLGDPAVQAELSVIEDDVQHTRGMPATEGK